MVQKIQDTELSKHLVVFLWNASSIGGITRQDPDWHVCKPAYKYRSSLHYTFSPIIRVSSHWAITKKLLYFLSSLFLSSPLLSFPSPVLKDIEADPQFSAAAAKSLQLRLTLCGPIDSSPPGSLVPGILQARTLEWVAISFPKHESEK